LDEGGWLRCWILWSWLNAIYGKCYWRRSAKRGYHIRVHGLSEKEVKWWREVFDDPVRLRLDDERLKKPKQILWTCKDGDWAGEWRDSLC
jgi:hypothetical protein